jgi:hypothetical protein
MQTALISALTAAAVTLLIEYFAKPALDVRKDRLVGASRARRDMIAALASFGNLLIRLTMAVSHGDWPNVATLFKTLDEKAAKLSERHAEAKQTLSLNASLLAGEALKLLNTQVTVMEWSIHSAEKNPAIDDPKGKEACEAINRIESKIGSILYVIEAAYRPGMSWTKNRRQDLVQTKAILDRIKPTG